MYVCLIITVKGLDRSVPNLAHISTLAQVWFLDIFFYYFFLFERILDGIVCEARGKGKGGEGQGRVGRGEEGLLNFDLIFQKTWAEPGNPS